MGLPLFELMISENDDTGVEAIALVDHPAIESNWHAFNKHKSVVTFNAKEQFQTVDKDKRIIAGFAMIAEQKMFRRDADGTEYDVFFSAKTIETIVQKFFKQKRTDQSNIMHNSNLMLDDVFMIESFIINSKRGITTPKGFEAVPDGSWFVAMKVDDLKLWEDFIKTGEFKGFSVEGIFEQVQVEFKNINMSKEIQDMVEVKTLLSKMVDFFKTKEQLDKHNPEEDERKEEEEEEKKEEKMGEVTLQSGDVLVYDGELEIGTTVRIISDEGELVAPDGEHESADGIMVIVTADSVVTDIQTKVEEIPVEDDVMADILAKLKAANEKIVELEATNKTLKEDFEKEATDLDKVTAELAKANKLKEQQLTTITELQKQEKQAPKEVPSGKPSWMTVDRSKL